MSTKRPDVISAPPSDMTALTLGEMHQLRWRVTATCSTCGIGLRVQLTALIRVQGPDGVLWGARPPCPNVKCEGGHLVYQAQSITGGSWKSLKDKPSDLAITRWKNSRGMYRGPR